MGEGENDDANSAPSRTRLKDLSRPEDFVILPRLDLAAAEFHWRVGYTLSYFGMYLDRPVFFERVRKDAVLSEPSFEVHRYLVIELTNEQFEQAVQLNETAKKAKQFFDERLAANQNRYTRPGMNLEYKCDTWEHNLAGDIEKTSFLVGWTDRPIVQVTLTGGEFRGHLCGTKPAGD
ncbi:MAG: hypothetical protein ACJ789_02370 [Thermomicrobiales bacterium]